MHRTLDRGWRFVRLPLDSTKDQADRAEKLPVDMPHDWLIRNTDNLYEDGAGWYYLSLPFSEKDAGKRVTLRFDGVYMDADILWNGETVCTHRYGYTAFTADVSGLVRPGGNELCVHVRHQSPNSRWYSGAGIFRPVTLYVTEPFALLPDGVRVNTVPGPDGRWRLEGTAEAAGQPDGAGFPAGLLPPEGVLMSRIAREGTGLNAFSFEIPRPALWEPEHPALYTLRLTLNGDTVEKRVGLRETRFDPNEGFFLNGRHMKLQGVCLHHDLALLGAAFHRDAAQRQLRVMREMGVNAVRTAHNPPAEEFLDLCDETGMLVMDELFDMWELPKTAYDNARFFPDTWQEDTASFVRRDRCHPCVILWSIGNEIQDLHVSARGQEWTRKLMDEVRLHDSVHAPVTFASNYMPWEGAQQCADIIQLPGYNYGENLYEKHHRQHPDWVIFGSETGSVLQSRGVYHFPMSEEILSEEDLQCSDLLNSNTSWGARDVPAMLTNDRLNPYTLGQFIWAGIDYIGEPTPYHTRSCYFGQADTACFPKNSYYLYQAYWTDRPVIHIAAVWDWNEGQLIDVPVMTNAASCELFLNGRSLGRKEVCLDSGEKALPVWQVPYEPGVLRAAGYGASGRILCEDRRESFADSFRLKLLAESETVPAGGIAFIQVSAEDVQGRPVMNACDRVRVRVSDGGVLLGLDNGDSADEDGYRTDCRRLFSGRLLIMAAALEAGPLTVRAEAEGLLPAEITLQTVPSARPCLLSARSAAEASPGKKGRDIRKITLQAERTPAVLSPAHPACTFRVSVSPEGADRQPLSFRVVNRQGVDVPYAKAEAAGGAVTVTTRGDGEFYLRATAANGATHARVISQMEIRAEGFGSASLDPYTFLSGSLGDVRLGGITPGNEKGISFARDGWSLIGFSGVDFGPVGSDTLTLPIFALNSDLHRITVWDGVPDAGGRQISVLSYRKPSRWNVYQAETWKLPEVLRGLHTLCFSTDQKFHLKGFSFEKQSRAFRGDRALSADRVYGDSFRRTEEAVGHIGNNVTLYFEHMDFGGGGRMTLLLDGLTRHEKDALTFLAKNRAGEETVETLMFTRTEAHGPQRFSVRVPTGECEVSFVFLPGSDFDFYAFRFEPEKTQKPEE